MAQLKLNLSKDVIRHRDRMGLLEEFVLSTWWQMESTCDRDARVLDVYVKRATLELSVPTSTPSELSNQYDTVSAPTKFPFTSGRSRLRGAFAVFHLVGDVPRKIINFRLRLSAVSKNKEKMSVKVSNSKSESLSRTLTSVTF